jgi:glyceraldehyde 3-phosphate dehydrogenase
MQTELKSKRVLGINGIGRIGKLTFWNHLNLRHFSNIVINAGRELGKKPSDIIQYLTTDSTYGSLDHFLYGHSGKTCEVTVVDAAENLYDFDGIGVKVLIKERNPRDIPWNKESVRLVIDCTGVFLDPSLPADHSKGSLRCHL